jgi:hypothetical protein
MEFLRRTAGTTPRVAHLSVLGALLLCGCYHYVPVQPDALRPNEEVRVRITESAATRLVKEFGAYTGELEGQLSMEGSDSLSVSVAIGREYRGMALENARQTLFLGRSEVLDVRRRQLARAKTALTTAGVLTAFGLLVNTIVQLSDDNPVDDNPPPPPPEFRALIRIPFR